MGFIFFLVVFFFVFRYLTFKGKRHIAPKRSAVIFPYSNESKPKSGPSSSRTPSTKFQTNKPTYQGSKFAQPGEKGKLFAYGSYRDSNALPDVYCLVDLETSGFNPPSAKILEIAILKINADGEILDEFNTLIDPQDGHVGPSNIHGIKLSMLKNAPTFSDATGPILKMIENSIVVAHNARFEENFLSAEFVNAGINLPLIPAIDTLWLSRQVLDLPNYKLDTVISSFNERIENAHTALGDVRAMAKVLPRMIEQSDRVFFPSSYSALPECKTNFRSKPR